MFEKIKLFFKWFFIISGSVMWIIFIILIIAFISGAYPKKPAGVYPPTTPGIEYVIEQFRERINQQADIIRSALAESDKIRADYKLTKQHLENAAKRINQLTVSNEELTKLNQAAGAEIRKARAILEKIGTTNIDSATIIIQLKQINQSIAESIDDKQNYNDK
ncbi:MAG: hypothetical protein PHS93_08185 [Candidatus Omnitrophica bacterium]|nr:hypothetical protein [Candidatus Omnitrophota bacterium]